MRFRCGLLAVFLALAAPALAQDLPIDQQLPPVAAPTHRVQVNQLPVLDTTPAFNASAATGQWLARVSPDARATANAFADSGHLLLFVDLGYGLGIAALLLWLRLSSRIRDWAEERTHSRSYQAMLYGVITLTAVTILSLPLVLYQSYFREQAFSSQSFTQWAGDFAILFTLLLMATVIFLPLFYAVIRAAREMWWLFGAGLTILFLVLGLAIYPIAIAPLFHHASPLPDTPLKQQILSLARANGVPADALWMTDDSTQSKRMSAGVSGFLGSTRILLGDNLVSQASPDEVLAMAGHEMGHYVMGHTTRLVLLFGLVILAGFGFSALAFHQATNLFGGNWQVRRPDDVAGLPLLAALLGLFLFVAMPVTNAMVRATEREADLFGVNAVRKPDAFASLALKLSGDRALEPGAFEEVIFFDRPSARDTIAMMMQWKAEHIRDLDIRDSVRDNPH